MPRKPKDPTATAKDGSRRAGPKRKKATKPSRTGKALELPLTPGHEAFIRWYMVRRNITRAYMEAYPEASYSTAGCEGSKLFRDPRISTRINALLEQEAKRLESRAARVTESLAAMAFGNLADVYDKNGNLIPPTELPRDVALAIKKLKRKEIIGKDGEGKAVVVGHNVEVEMHERTPALRLLGLEHGMFVEKVQHSMSDAEVLAALDRGRDRVRAARKAG